MAAAPMTWSRDPFRTTVYVPCHFDFSQLEYVLPFLLRHGGKVFVYDWHPHKARMLEAFSDLGISTFPFTLEMLMSNILSEKTPVVFLMTASVSAEHGFGALQHKLLTALATLLPDRVRAVSIIGHCMYGCSSCTGAQHKVPVYWTRFFHDALGYTAATERDRYRVVTRAEAAAQSLPLTVLVAPSTAESSLMCQPDIVAAMWALQQAGSHRFVWKLHPGAFNLAEFDLTYEPHRIELANIDFIKTHMEVVDEERHVMLPFMDAFDVIVCDLHSTVAFMALYFAPKTILAYDNDADYGTPDRAPEFLEALNLFDTPAGLRDLLLTAPQPRGSRAFFTQMYGDVDGTEDLRFAQLAQWPTLDTPPPAPVSGSLGVRLAARARLAWGQLFCRSLTESTATSPVDVAEDRALCLEAVGLNRAAILDVPALQVELQELAGKLAADTELFPDSMLAAEQRSPLPTTPSWPHLDPHARVLRVMSFNIWIAGEGEGTGVSRLADIARVICDTQCDVVLLQEVAGRPRVGGAVSPDRTDELALLLGWAHCLKQGIAFKAPGNNHPYSILSRYPLSPTPGGFGASLDIPGSPKVSVFNTHLPHFPYQPYQLCRIPYGHAPFLSTAEQAVAAAIECRQAHVHAVIADMATAARAGHALILGMDANEPAPNDWTPLAMLAGVHPCTVTWPSLREFLSHKDLRLRDALRELHPASAPHEEHRTRGDHRDRIDFVLYSPGQHTEGNVVSPVMRLRAVAVVGEDESPCSDVRFTEWPSDHRAVLATFELL